MKFETFVKNLFDTVGSYRTTTYNQAAIEFIRKGAGLGLKIADKLPDALKAHEAHAAQLLNTRADDSGYTTLLRVAELLAQAAVKRLYYAQKEEDNKVALRVRVQGYSLSTAAASSEKVGADAWAEQSTVEEAEEQSTIDFDPESRAMEEVDATVRLTVEDVREALEQLVALLTPFALRADQIVNSWRSDYGQRPAIPYLAVPLASGGYKHASTVDEALNMLALMEDERAIQQRMRTRVQVQASALSWA
jgi:hypothetical protein